LAGLFGLAAQAHGQSVSIYLAALSGVSPIPGGTGSFTRWPPNASISFGNNATVGTGAGAARGCMCSENEVEGAGIQTLDPVKVTVNLDARAYGGCALLARTQL